MNKYKVMDFSGVSAILISGAGFKSSESVNKRTLVS